MRRQGEEDGDRGQNEQGSSCLESVPGPFVRRTFIAEPLWCGGIVPMAVGPSHKIAKTISTSSGGAIHAPRPIQKLKSFFASTTGPATNGRRMFGGTIAIAEFSTKQTTDDRFGCRTIAGGFYPPSYRFRGSSQSGTSLTSASRRCFVDPREPARLAHRGGLEESSTMQHVFELLPGLVVGVGACRDHRGLVEGQEVTTTDDHLLYERARELLSNERRWPSSNGARSRSGLRDARREFESASVPMESWWLNAAKAQETADAECATYSRVALMRLTADLDEANYVFECVAR
jgi:hypothetical protein